MYVLFAGAHTPSRQTRVHRAGPLPSPRLASSTSSYQTPPASRRLAEGPRYHRHYHFHHYHRHHHRGDIAAHRAHHEHQVYRSAALRSADAGVGGPSNRIACTGSRLAAFT